MGTSGVLVFIAHEHEPVVGARSTARAGRVFAVKAVEGVLRRAHCFTSTLLQRLGGT